MKNNLKASSLPPRRGADRFRSAQSFLFTTWEGGGNIAPAITVAGKLLRRGHRVRFMSDRVNRARVALGLTSLASAPAGKAEIGPRSCRGAASVLYSVMPPLYPTLIPGLRSPFEQVKGIVYFGRMLDKIRLAAAGTLPPAWMEMRGTKAKGTFDSRCCRFLHLDYAELEAETLRGRGDEELLEWAFAHGRKPTEEEIEIWNAFMTKRGWRDAGTKRLNERLAEIGLPPGTVETVFEFMDLDEGRSKLGKP